MQQIPDGVLRRREEVGGNAANSKVGAKMQAKVASGDVAVDGVLEGCNVGRGDSGVNLGLRGESLCDVGIQVAGQTGWVVVEGSRRERSAGESDTNVNGCKGGLVVSKRAAGDATTAGTVRNCEVGAEGNGAGVVEHAVAGH